MIRERVSKINYYLDIAEAVSERGTCLRRNYGAIIVNNDEIISTGYVGAPRGRKNCSDLGKCMRMELNIPSLSQRSCRGKCDYLRTEKRNAWGNTLSLRQGSNRRLIY